jgi:hypothetical protein
MPNKIQGKNPRRIFSKSFISSQPRYGGHGPPYS